MGRADIALDLETMTFFTSSGPFFHIAVLVRETEVLEWKQKSCSNFEYEGYDCLPSFLCIPDLRPIHRHDIL